MIVTTPHFVPSAEAFRARSRDFALPDCGALRSCAALTALAQFAMVTRMLDFGQLGLLVQSGFAFCGFLLTGFLLRERGGTEARRDVESGGILPWFRTMGQIIPISWLALVIAGILFLPSLFALKSLPVPDLTRLPAQFNRVLLATIPDFLNLSFDGASLLVWPLIVLVAPRRMLGLGFVVVLGSGLAIRLLSLFAGEVGPASILAKPSAFDLLAAGSLLALMFHRDQDAGHGRLGRWAVLTGLAMAAVTLVFRSHGELPDWGSVGLLTAPTGFGIVNFIGEILATVMVASLSWRDIGGMFDGLGRLKAH